MIQLAGHGVLSAADLQFAGGRFELRLVLFVPQIAKQARHALFQAGEQIGEPGGVLGQIAFCVFVHQQRRKACHGVIIQLQERFQPAAWVVRSGVGVQRHLQHPVHQSAALVGRKLRPLAGFQPQHILQEIAVPAGIVFFQLAGRDAQFPAQQSFQRGQVFHLPGRVFFHAAQQFQSPGRVFAGDVQRFGQTDTFDLGQRPAAAQRVQTVRRGGGKVGQFQLRQVRVQGVHDGFQRRAQGLPLPFGPAEPKSLCRSGECLVKADLFAHHAVLEAVRQFDLVCHQGVPVGVGKQTALGGCPGELPFRKPQHEHIIRRIQTHLAGAGQHHGVQRLRDVPQIRRAQQQAEQLFVFRNGHALTAQQMRHFVQ